MGSKYLILLALPGMKECWVGSTQGRGWANPQEAWNIPL
jgi:hypothetical protein